MKKSYLLTFSVVIFISTISQSQDNGLYCHTAIPAIFGINTEPISDDMYSDSVYFKINLLADGNLIIRNLDNSNLAWQLFKANNCTNYQTIDFSFSSEKKEVKNLSAGEYYLQAKRHKSPVQWLIETIPHLSCENVITARLGINIETPKPFDEYYPGDTAWFKIDMPKDGDLFIQNPEYGFCNIKVFKESPCSNAIYESSNSDHIKLKNLTKGTYYFMVERHGKPVIWLIDTIPPEPICSLRRTNDIITPPENQYYTKTYSGDSALVHMKSETDVFYPCTCKKPSNPIDLQSGENTATQISDYFRYIAAESGTANFNFQHDRRTWMYKIGNCNNYHLLQLENSQTKIPDIIKGNTLYLRGYITDAEDQTFSFLFLKHQVIDFLKPSDILLSSGSFALPELSSAGLPIHYEVLSGNAKISPCLLELNAPGPVTIEASQPGNEIYDSARSITHTFCILPDKPVITIDHFTSSPMINLVSNNPAGNQWYKNYELIANANDYFLPVAPHSVEETYSVITNVDGCQSEMSDAFTVTSIPEFLHEQALFPNPATNSLRVAIKQIKNPESIEVYSLTGNIYNSPWRIIHQSGQTLVELNTASLPAGGYLLKIRTSDQIATYKFMKK